MAARPKRVSLPLEDGLIQLQSTGSEPVWIWAETCPMPDCDCRSAVVIASRSGKESLLASASKVKKLLAKGDEIEGVEAVLSEDCAGVELEIDSGQVESAGEADLASTIERAPWLQSVLDRIDGAVLDDLGRLWYRGKGQPDPELAPVHPREIRDWKPGDEVSWEEAYWSVRDDLYLLDEQLYEVSEFYCVMPDCDCGRVMLRVGKVGEKADVLVGSVTIEKTGECELKTDDGNREELDRIWAAYQKRYPEYRERHAARELRMREFGKALVEHHAAASAPKVGQNDPCPCGSGKKYKKCCWKKQIGG